MNTMEKINEITRPTLKAPRANSATPVRMQATRKVGLKEFQLLILKKIKYAVSINRLNSTI